MTSQPGRAARWYASGEMTVRKGSSGPDAGLGKFETVAFPSRGRFERLIIRKEPERADPGVSDSAARSMIAYNGRRASING